MKIALDCMGGDNAPAAIVKGAVEAAREFEIDVALVGPKKQLFAEVERLDFSLTQNIEYVHAPEFIRMDESPVKAITKKKDSSLVVANRLVKERRADAVISAGNTGAAMACGIFILGRIENIDRPAIATFMPTKGRPTILLDVGANVDCAPGQLLQFARMGSTYAEEVLKRSSPRVGLLNIGAESIKGNELSHRAHRLLAEGKLNFVGNVEGRDIFSGRLDIVVCDGFVGNVALKTAEGIVEIILDYLQREISASSRARIGAFFMRGVFRSLKKQIDYAEYGGAPLLGVNGITIIAHGSSRSRAIKNACLRAKEAHANSLINRIKSIPGHGEKWDQQ